MPPHSKEALNDLIKMYLSGHYVTYKVLYFGPDL